MHGHNYRAEVTVRGREGIQVNSDGYLLDFGQVKASLKSVCSEMDERFLCAAHNPALGVTQQDASGSPCELTFGADNGAGQLVIVYNPDGSTFSWVLNGLPANCC